MPRRQNNQEPSPFSFWDFANHLAPPGQGVDSHSNLWENLPPPQGPWGHWSGGPGAAWANFMGPEAWGQSPWDEFHHHAGRGRRGHRRPGRYPNESEGEQHQQHHQQSDETTDEKAQNDKDNSPDTMAVDSAPDPEEVLIQDSDNDRDQGRRRRGREGERHRGGGPCRRGHGGPRGGGFFSRRGGPHHPAFGAGGHGHHHDGPPPYDGAGSNFNFAEIMRGFMAHPLFQSVREQVINSTQPPTNAAGQSSGSESFTPPVDTFSTPSAYVLHVAIPGAAKEDVAVNWDPERHLLQVTGVVHRPGDEDFIGNLVTGERRIGLFEREIRLPPAGVERSERDEVDGQGISARMENGLLVVTVPKVEKEWTQVTRVDIE